MIAPPSMVISSFSIELFLKCILLLENQTVPDIHHLSKLYRRISHKRKRRIEELWDAHGRPRLSKIAQAEVLLGNQMPTDLPNALVQCSAAFERLRYAYENDYRGVKFYLGDLPKILRNVILEIKPDWGAPSTLKTYSTA